MPDVTLDLGNQYIGSAYSPQVAITETETGHQIDFTFADSEHPGQLTTEGFEVPNYASEEAEREAAEAERAAAESARVAAEEGRMNRELDRVFSENARINAEELREDAETARASAEQARAAAETARAGAEASRASAEQARTSAESARASAEAGRTTAESARVSAEQARATAETARASAEAARESAEATRQANTTAAIARADAATAAANTATTNADAATTAAQAATGEAEDATDAANAAAALATAAAETVTDAYFPNLTAGAAEGITGGGPTDTAAWTYRACPGTDGPATIESIHGRTVVWNQLVGSDTASVTVPSGHKYVSYIETTVDDATTTVKTLATSDGTAIATTGGTDCVFDLTAMFGAGNEPSTVAEFEALYPEPYYPYDAGSLLSVQMEGIETVGFNQLDLANPKFGVNYNKDVGSVFSNSPSMTVSGENPCTLTANAAWNGVTYVAEVFEGQTYQFTTSINAATSSSTKFTYYMLDDNYAVVRKLGNYSANSNINTNIKPRAGERYFAASYSLSDAGTMAITNTCLHLVWSGYRDGEYEPYWKSERTIPAATYFPQGMRSAGIVYDELTSEEAVTRVGEVDLGTLSWSYSNNRLSTDSLMATIKKPTSASQLPDIQPEKYNVVSYSASLADHPNALTVINTGRIMMYAASADAPTPTGMLYYALATTTVTPIDPPLNLSYRVSDFGTERIIHTDPTAAPTLVITYGSTADGIRDRALACIARIEGSTASANYGVGSYLIHGGTLCRVTTAIATGEAITIGTNVTATTVMAELLTLTQ